MALKVPVHHEFGVAMLLHRVNVLRGHHGQEPYGHRHEKAEDTAHQHQFNRMRESALRQLKSV